jgi:hypothetical protein
MRILQDLVERMCRGLLGYDVTTNRERNKASSIYFTSAFLAEIIIENAEGLSVLVGLSPMTEKSYPGRAALVYYCESSSSHLSSEHPLTI